MILRTICPVALFLLLVVGCNTEVTVVPYPCKRPDPGYVGPDGKPDPCHFEDPNSPAAAVDAFFGAAAPPFCEALFACCTDTTFLQSFAGGSVDNCKAGWSRGENLGDRTLLSLKTALVNGQSVFDPAKLDACVTHLKTMAAGGAACVEPVPFYLFNVCMGAFQGQVAPDEACTWGMSNVEDLSFVECKDGRCFDGKCVPFLKTGDVCIGHAHITDSPDTTCNLLRGEWCIAGGVYGTCSPRHDLGETCFDAEIYICKSLTCGNGCALPTPDDSACNVY
jgi:hypothetical protein